MSRASLDVLAVLPAPAIRANGTISCSDLLDDQLFAYGSGSSVVVVQAGDLRVQLALYGEHRDSHVTAVKWAPDCHSRDLKTSSHLRLASGDSDGQVVVWDVRATRALARFPDRVSEGGSLLGGAGAQAAGGGSSVTGLAWVLGQPWLLAVMMAAGNLVLWDTRGGVVVWQRELLSGEQCCCMVRDPLDARRLAVCGAAGALCLINLTDPQGGTVAMTQYRVSLQTSSTAASGSGAAASTSGAGGPPSFQAEFSPARDVLFLALSREIVVFDLELGLPAASVTLPNSKPAFACLLGVYGATVSHGLGTEGGTAILYAAHTDGALSAWARSPGELRFVNVGWFRLTPTPVRGAANAIMLLTAKAQVWPSTSNTLARTSQCMGCGVSSSEELTRALRGHLLPDRVAPDASGGRDIFGGVMLNAGNNNGTSRGGASTSGAVAAPRGSDQHVAILCVTSDGRLWRWQAVLPAFHARTPTSLALTSVQLSPGGQQAMAPPPVPPPPLLTTLTQLLPSPLTCVAMFPRPLLLTDLSACFPGHSNAAGTAPSSTTGSAGGGGNASHLVPSPFYSTPTAAAHGNIGRGSSPGWQPSRPQASGNVSPVGEVGLMGAGLTLNGQLQVFTVQRGQASPLSVQLVLSLSVHKEGGVARGLRWLGRTPRVLTFMCDKAQPAGAGAGGGGGSWRNTMAITDLRTRRTTHFREVAGEQQRLAGVRASPSGYHVLLIFRNAPSELWAVGVDPPIKLMSLDVAWSAPEWLSTSDPTNPSPLRLHDLLDTTSHTPCSTSAYESTLTPAPSSPFSGPPMPTMDSFIMDGSSKALGGATTPKPSGGSLLGPMTSLGPGSSAAAEVAPPPVPYKNPQNAWQVTVNAVTAAAPEEFIAYTYDEGIKSGVLRVRGRHVVNDDRVRRPRLPIEEPQNFDATAMCGWGSVVVMGDAEGRLAVWSTATGATSLIHTGCGYIRRLHVAPPPHPSLYAPTEKGMAITARVACLFGDGTFGVYELGPRGQLRPGHASPVVTSRGLGRATDICWLPLPCEGGGGSVLMLLSDTGSLVAVDVSQAGDRRPSHTHRTHALRSLLSTPVSLAPPKQAPPKPASKPPAAPSSAEVDLLGDEVPLAPVETPATSQEPPLVRAAKEGALRVVLAAPPPVSCALLLPRPWVLLLRMLLQLGLPAATLQALAGIACHTARPEIPATPGVPSPSLMPTGPPRSSAVNLQQQAGDGSKEGGYYNGDVGALSSQQQAGVVSDAVEELMSLMPLATHKAFTQALAKHYQQQQLAQQQQTGAGGGLSIPGAAASSPGGGVSRRTSEFGAISEIEEAPPESTPATIHAGGQADGKPSFAAASVPGLASSPPDASGGVFMKAMGDALKMVRSTTQGIISTASTMLDSQPTNAAPAGLQGGADKQRHSTAHLPSDFHTDLLGLLRHMATCRAGGQLLTPSEWADYTLALSLGTTSSGAGSMQEGPAAGGSAGIAGGGGAGARVAQLCACCVVAAQVSGDNEAARFWRHLPATLQAVRELQASLAPLPTSLYQVAPPGLASPAPGHAQPLHPPEPVSALRVPQRPGGGGGGGLTGSAVSHPAAAGAAGGLMLTSYSAPGDIAGNTTPSKARPAQPGLLGALRSSTRLWDEDSMLAEAQERTVWHESLSRSSTAASQELQERRLLEYVVLGDFQTAVAFLLASTPEQSVRYYRDALITAALAAAANMKPGTGARQIGSALQLQAAKVLSAHAASIGDPLMGVPLHCAAGLYAEAVSLLQECGMWRAAATLTAHALVGAERGLALQRWADHVYTQEGGLWRAVGILVAGGCCREALKLLQVHGRPDSAAAFLAACHAAGLTHTTHCPAAAPTGPFDGQHGFGQDGPVQKQGRGSLEGRSSLGSGVGDGSKGGSGRPALAQRMSLSKGEILHQQAVFAAAESLAQQASAAGGGSGEHVSPAGVMTPKRASSGTDALLSSALSTGWPSTTITRVFSILSATASGPHEMVAVPGSTGSTGLAMQQQDDAAPVQLQFERFVCDLLQHM